MKTVGIIGGLGPETTSEFYLGIVFSCQKKEKTIKIFDTMNIFADATTREILGEKVVI